MGRKRREWAQLDLLAVEDEGRLLASLDSELEREAAAPPDTMLTVIMSRDQEEGLRARKRFYNRAVRDRRLLLLLLVRFRKQLLALGGSPGGPVEWRDVTGRCVP